jgi:hypothetical protein
MNTNKNKTPDYLIFQAVQCATNYSDWDVKIMLDCLNPTEIQSIEKYFSTIP